MSNETRKTYDGKFKLDVVIAFIKGNNNIEDLCKKYGVTAGQIYAWKTHLDTHGCEIFEDKRKKEKDILKEKELNAKLDEVTTERDFLSRVLKR